jgi:membrane-bound lytic murein transglycosylase D
MHRAGEPARESFPLDYNGDDSGKPELFQTRLDSTVALLEFGDVGGFLAARDSLDDDISSFLEHHPDKRSDRRIIFIQEELARLDSLAISREYRHEYLSLVDSMALSLFAWPEPTASAIDSMHATAADTVFPYIEDKRIEFWIKYFTGPGKKRFARNLTRMDRYRPIIEEILRELDLPSSLICIPVIESGFNMKARSRAKAVGPWQFLAGTGRIYGLRINWWLDERRDIVASTYAAGNYLKDLYALWNDWFLALAAYNAGEYRVARAIVRQKTEDFWKLKLPKQTQRYVPKFLAALYIMREPAKYGFEIPPVEPLQFDVVRVTDATDLKLIARSADTSVHTIRELNPELLRWCTPPRTEVAVKVPKGKGALCMERLNAIPPSRRVTWRKHRIRRGETLSQIARHYGTTVLALKRLNGIRNSHLIRTGATLIVPMKGDFAEKASIKPAFKTRRRKLDRRKLEAYARKGGVPSGYKSVKYLVKDHDTLGEIAELFHTSARKIRLWNNLSYRSYIYPGQKLKIYVPKSFDVSKVVGPSHSRVPSGAGYVKKSYVVKPGDTLYKISRRFKVRVSDLLVWNRKTPRSIIRPGEQLKIFIKAE